MDLALPVICMTRAPSPSNCAVLVPALMTGLVGIIPTIIVKVTLPQGWDTFTIVAGELLIIAGPVVANIVKLIRAVSAVFVTIALPCTQYTFSTVLALEHVLWTVVLTHFFVALVTTVIESVANGRGQDATLVLALELSLLAHTLRAGIGLIGVVLAILLAVALPVVGHTAVILSIGAAAVLTGRAVGDAVLLIRSQNKVVGTSAAVIHTLEIVGCNETKMRARAVFARIVVAKLLQRMINMNIVGSVSGVVERLDVFPGKLVGPHDGFQVPV